MGSGWGRGAGVERRGGEGGREVKRLKRGGYEGVGERVCVGGEEMWAGGGARYQSTEVSYGCLAFISGAMYRWVPQTPLKKRRIAARQSAETHGPSDRENNWVTVYMRETRAISPPRPKRHIPPPALKTTEKDSDNWVHIQV